MTSSRSQFSNSQSQTPRLRPPLPPALHRTSPSFRVHTTPAFCDLQMPHPPQHQQLPSTVPTLLTTIRRRLCTIPRFTFPCRANEHVLCSPPLFLIPRFASAHNESLLLDATVQDCQALFPCQSHHPRPGLEVLSRCVYKTKRTWT